MKVKCFQLGPIGTNCYLLENSHKDALIIDPGGDGDFLTEYLQTNHLKPVAIVLTHAHFDHIGAVDLLKETFGLDVFLHEVEHDWLSNVQKNGSATLIGNAVTIKSIPLPLVEGHTNIGSFTMQILHTPGHSPGSISLVFHDFVISGDVLFHQGIGRTDLFGGDIHALENSIRNKLYKLPDNYVVYAGHGSSTVIGDEKNNNPFVDGN